VDHLGSTRLVTDGSGAVYDRRDFYPFGEQIPAQSTTSRDSGSIAGYNNADLASGHLFTGKERDEESKLDYFGARYYASAVGRFTGPDRPLVDQQAESPQSWNLYSYVRNNPMSATDPSGSKCRRVDSSSISWEDDGTGGGCALAALNPPSDKEILQGMANEFVDTLNLPADVINYLNTQESERTGRMAILLPRIPLPFNVGPRAQLDAMVVSLAIPFGLGGKASKIDDAVDLFRAVGKSELADLFRPGVPSRFRTTYKSLPVKQFGFNLAETEQFGRFVKSEAIIRVRVPRSLLDRLDLTHLDAATFRQGTVTVPQQQLKLFNESIIELERVR
jgi:RHS repeat-associated protein